MEVAFALPTLLFLRQDLTQIRLTDPRQALDRAEFCLRLPFGAATPGGTPTSNSGPEKPARGNPNQGEEDGGEGQYTPFKLRRHWRFPTVHQQHTG